MVTVKPAKAIKRHHQKEAGMTKSLITFSLLAGSVLLAGCGGGGEEEDSNGSTSSRTGSLSMISSDAREGDDNSELTVQVRLSQRLDNQVSVDYETRDGTATAGEDYTSTSGNLIIPKGASQGTFDVVITGDGIDEEDEFFEVILSNPVGAKLSSSDATATFTITNDDNPPVISFETRQQSVAEDVGQAKVYATLSEVSGNQVTAELDVTGTALDNDDYALDKPVLIEFQPGDVRSSFDIEIKPDSIPEGGETINLAIGSLDNAITDERDGISEHTVIILGDTALNDTGLVTFSDGVNAGLTLEPSSHPGQDASHGRDTLPEPDFDGHEGFSFTKLDTDGNPLPSNSPTWSCTLDNVTGVVWENKTPEKSLAPTFDPESGDTIPVTISLGEFRAANFRYDWRVNDENNNGGSPGVVENGDGQLDSSNPVGEECAYGADSGRRARMYCNTRSYLEEMNRLGICGFQDWRMPSIEELRSIANYDVADNSSAPDTRFFSRVHTDTRYWSGTPAADNSASAWCFEYATGEVKLCQKAGQSRGFMAVRSPK